MATDSENFNKDLYDLLKVRGYDPVPLNSKNQRVNVSQDADVFQFDFKKDGEDYGNAWVTVDDAHNVIVYYNQEQQNSPSTMTPGVEYDDTWTGFCKVLKTWAQRRQLGFELKNASHVGDDMRQRDYYRMKEKLGESYHAMGKKASYNDAVPNVKIILQHNRALEEGEQRYRNIARIFLENTDGERFLAPTTRPGIARVYARHIAEGGMVNDEKWNHIKGLCEEYSKMAGFVRATRNKQFNESAQTLINEGHQHYNNLRETLHKLTGHRGYHNYFENYTPMITEENGLDISEMFTASSMDPRIESALPIISRLYKKVDEMKEVDTLDQWTDGVISETIEEGQLLEDSTEDKLSQLHHLKKINVDPMIAKVIDAKISQLSKKKGLNELSTGKKWDYTVFGSENVNKLLDKIPGSGEDEANRLMKKANARSQNIRKVTKSLTNIQENDYTQIEKYFIVTIPGKDPFRVRAKNRDEAATEIAKRYGMDDEDIRIDTDRHHARFVRTEPKYDATSSHDPLNKAQELAKEKYKEKLGGVLGGLATIAGGALNIRENSTEIEEDLGPEQKRVGQLGPYEKVGKKGAVGKLVGASESTEHDELSRLIDVAHYKNITQ